MSPLAHPKGKTPSRSAISERGSFLVLTARQPSVKPLANVVRRYIRCDGQDKGRNRLHWASPPLPNKWAGKAANPLYHTFRQKDTENAKSRTFLQRKGSPSYNLSVSLRSPRPGCGSQHPPRSACVLLAAAPTAPPCFRHWRRSSPLPLVGEPLAERKTLN